MLTIDNKEKGNIKNPDLILANLDNQKTKRKIEPPAKQKLSSFVLMALFIISIECFICAFIIPFLMPGPKDMNRPQSNSQATVMFVFLGISMAIMLFEFLFIFLMRAHSKRKANAHSLSADDNKLEILQSTAESRKLNLGRVTNRALGFILVAVTGIVILAGATVAIVVSENHYMNEQIHNLSSQDAKTVSNAVDVLAKIRDPRVVKPLTAVLQDENNNIRYSVVMALIKLGDKSIEPNLISALYEFGNVDMANIYLNCGNDQLSSAARTWGESNGYHLIVGGSSSGPRWGNN
jgi:hypothetical protein